MENKSNFGMKCMKYLLVLINVLYLILSFLMISGPATLKIVIYNSWDFDTLFNLWIATGCLLLAISIFGIAAAIKESTVMANMYGIVLSVTFVLQMATAITSFVLISQSSRIVFNYMDRIMYGYEYNFDYRNTMNWIQTTLSCCGNEGPSDWNRFRPYAVSTTTQSWWGTSPITDDSTITTMEQRKDRMPQSCCARDSFYEDMMCDSHFTGGCHDPLHKILSDSVMSIGLGALTMGVFQILGIICAFMLARAIRRNKTNRGVQRWTNHRNIDFDGPAYVQLPAPEVKANEIKYI